MLGGTRVRVLRGLVVFALMVIISRLVWVQVVKADEIVAKSDDIRLTKQDLKPVRGNIVDRNLMPMAITVPTYKVVANQLQIESRDEPKVADALAEALGISRDELLKLLRDHPSSGYIPLKSGLTLQQKDQVEQLNLLGISTEMEQNRQYPAKSLAGQIIGYTQDGKGAAGLELQYDEQLGGAPGHVVAEFTYGNTAIESTIKEKVEPVPGRTLVLGIDTTLQKLAEDKLDEVIKKEDAKRGAIMVMDIHTGEMLVMAMRPGADPGDRKTWGDPINFALLKPWVVTPLPPGSVFKMITSSAALEERAITLSTTFIDKGYLKLNGCTITNWDGFTTPNPEPQAIDRLMQRSSNVGLVQVGMAQTHDNFVKYLQGFGMLEKTGIDLDYEEGPNLGPPFAEKRECDWANMFIGQHAEYTPLQMITAAAAIANGGTLLQPHLVREMRDPDGKVVWTAPVVQKRQVISSQTAKEVRDIMVSVIEKAYPQAKPKGYTAGGKTGTAQKFANGKIADRGVANFIGFAPAENPQVVMMVTIDDPRPPGYGGVISAPVFGELMPHVLRSLGIAPGTPAATGTETAPKPAVQGVVPDVIWMPRAWAEARLAEAGFTPRTKGDGPLVSAQSIQPGTAEKTGAIIELTLAAAPTGDTVHVPDFTGYSLTEASRLATEVGLTLKSGGAGFVVDQEPKKGQIVAARSTLTVRLAPRR
jgi:cell division protein FtsI/penicillin-binding protein 2